MAIIGAILGDIAGSQYEYDRPADLDWKHCDIFTDECEFTDDTVMTLAIKYAIDNKMNYQDAMQKIGRDYPVCGYGDTFFNWIYCTNPKPYNSFGNGAAMRVSYIGEHYEDIDTVMLEAVKSAEVSHNHPEGIKGAITTAVCVWLAKHKASKQDIYDYVIKQYPADKYKFSIDKPLSYLRENYSWDVTCMTSVPVAMRCFYESKSYISFIRNVFSLDCDCDTLCAIGGGVAEEFYGKTGFKNENVLKYYLDEKLYQIYKEEAVPNMGKGYRLRYKNEWLAVRRFYGYYVCYPYEDENDPNVRKRATRKVAERLREIALQNTDLEDIELVECGELTEEEAEMDVGRHLTQRRIR